MIIEVKFLVNTDFQYITAMQELFTVQSQSLSEKLVRDQLTLVSMKSLINE